MKAGSMRHVVDVLRPFVENDSRGAIDPLQGEKVLKSIPCSIRPLTATEQSAARQTYALATHRVEMYADPQNPIGHTFWLMWGARRLDVNSALLDDRGLAYTLTCSEVTA